MPVSNIVSDLRPLAKDIRSLRPMSGNARYHDSESIEGIRNSLREYGQRKPVVIRPDGEIVAGNGTYEAALEEGWEELAAVVVEEDRTTSLGYSIADNRTGDMSEWGNEALRAALKELEGTDLFTGFDEASLAKILSEGLGGPGGGGGEIPIGGEGDDPNYERKVEAPIYEPKGDCPEVSDLFDLAKTKELLAAIEAADIPEPEKAFLRAAANRHTVFDYENIAEFYAHASPELQGLMEDSALVIIDFDKAIEKGFVKLVGALGEAYDRDLAAKEAEDAEEE
jgi:ParB-like chromosome segregation protein Spo0J